MLSLEGESTLTAESLNRHIEEGLKEVAPLGTVAEFSIGYRSKIKFSKESVLRLRADQGEGSWLEDSHVEVLVRDILRNNASVKLIANAFFHHKLADPPDGCAWDHGSIANWTRRSGIHGADAGVILFCEDFHWYFILVDMKENVVKAVDSMGTDRASSMSKVVRWLKAEGAVTAGCSWDEVDWHCENVVSTAQQRNAVDCGVFVIGYVQALANKMELSSFTQEHCLTARRAAFDWITGEDEAGDSEAQDQTAEGNGT